MEEKVLLSRIKLKDRLAKLQSIVVKDIMKKCGFAYISNRPQYNNIINFMNTLDEENKVENAWKVTKEVIGD